MFFSVLNSFVKLAHEIAEESPSQSSYKTKLFVQRSPRAFAPGKVGRASTRCYAARAGEMRLLASDSTQRKMQLWAVPCAPPNPSIERTSPGKPGDASHGKR